MVFAHGFGCDQAMWRFVAPEFAADYRVVLFDYLGHGGSDASAYDPARYATLDGYASDVLDILDALDVDQVTFVGHSVSAMVGLLAAKRAPERFDRLILVGPSPYYLNDPPHYRGGFDRVDIEGLLDAMQQNYTAWAGALAPVIVGNADRPEYGQELTASFCAADPAIATDFARVTFLSDHRADLKTVRTPSLVLQCADDIIAPDAVGSYLAEHLPDSTLYRMAATGHCPHLTHPIETAAVIRAYLAQPPCAPILMGGR